MQIGRKIYYDKATGNIIVDIGEKQGFVKETTMEDDFAIYKVLSERNPETVGMIQLYYGQYSQDFRECNGYRVNPETKELEFSYPDPNLPPEEQPIVYQKPLSEKLQEQEQAIAELSAIVSSLITP